MSSKKLLIAIITLITSLTYGMDKNAGDLSSKEKGKLKELIDKRDPQATVQNLFNYCDTSDQTQIAARIQAVKQLINSKDFVLAYCNQLQDMVLTKQLIDADSLEKTIININNFCRNSNQYLQHLSLTKTYMSTEEFKTTFINLLNKVSNEQGRNFLYFRDMSDSSPWYSFVYQEAIYKLLQTKNIEVSIKYVGPHACFGESEYRGDSSSQSSSQSSSSESTPSSSYGDYSQCP